MASEVGTVSELWRYPVQSLQGESLPALQFTAQGVVGDRGYSIVDDTGEGGTAARPQWKALIGWRARYLAEPAAGADLPKVEITFDDGTQMVSDDARLGDAISVRLGRRGRLAVTMAPDVKRPYVASPCHLLTSATLKALSAAYPNGRFVSQRFRPNVLLGCGDQAGFIETGWLHQSLTVGPVAMKAVEHCLRCALTTRPQGELPKDPGILHTAQQHNENRVGIYAEISAPGTVRIGDVARLNG
ncbi:MOSC domain-containing protein [Dongia deserti]|uniref:MOSC domain-containing protein n=1 Tax=Dongia deserti TaxID=2268030 RepID=UPI000E656689|nr:MOSC N-terminal beta barrel domain-containing protein [Dongia deserti]